MFLYLLSYLPKGGAIFPEKALIMWFFRLMKSIVYKIWPEDIRHRIMKWFGPGLFFLPPKAWKTRRLVSAWIFRGKLSANGENGFLRSAWPDFKTGQGAGDRAVFPPQVMMEIKALACELPAERNIPFSRFSNRELAREAVRRGIVATISGATVWRWLSADAIKPWSFRSWIFPRDPNFAEKAERILDLYQGIWKDKQLAPNDYVISADEKTSIQARRRISPGMSPGPGRARRVEFEYERGGALAYMAAWDVRNAKVFGLCEKKTGIDPYHRLVDLVMQQEPYRSARRVFWVTDNGSSHRGQKSIKRLASWYKNAIQIHTPIHASWLNQIEIYFSVIQRKILTPNDFKDLADLEKRLLDFQTYYQQIAKPFKWKFTKRDLKRVLDEVSQKNSTIDRLAA